MIEQGTRFIGFSPRVDLSERKTANSNSETEPYTVDDIRGYKVFTALLTQSGEDDSVGQTSGTLVIGRTYYISNDCCGADFTNVGAPNNNLGTSFVATGQIPNAWGGTPSGDPQLTYNTGAPVATVLENTIGNVWFTYDGVGTWAINSNGLFTLNKTYPDFKNIFSGQLEKNLWEDMEESDLPNKVAMLYLNSSGTHTSGADLLRVEIRVYN